MGEARRYGVFIRPFPVGVCGGIGDGWRAGAREGPISEEVSEKRTFCGAGKGRTLVLAERSEQTGNVPVEAGC